MALTRTIKQLEAFAKEIRKLLLQAAFNAKSGHIGSALSTVDIITALYNGILNINPKKPLQKNRDIFILSKGHGCLGLYAALASRGFFSKEILANYFKDKTKLTGHPVLGSAAGIEASTGSLGHGFPMAVGMAYGFKAQNRQSRIVAMISDGECDEGSTWEAALAAPNFKLNNLTVVIDYNKIQSFGTVKEVMGLEPFAQKWRAFGWNVLQIDGHNFKQIFEAFKKAKARKKGPTVIIAHTIKGKGVKFMENKVEWHYFNLDAGKLKAALAGL
jgi:transketolase